MYTHPELLARMAVVEASFEGRWSLRSLKRVDAELYQRLVEQRQLWQEARIVGELADIELQGEALIRGWIAAVDRMESLSEPDNAYQLGQHNGMLVAIGERPPGGPDVAGGRRVVWLTPDEVAAMVEGLQMIAAVKELWPGAEVVRAIERYPDEPAQED